MDWTETGGPPPEPNGSKGFGTTLVVRQLEGPLGGQAKFDFSPQGLTVRLSLPIDGVGTSTVYLTLPELTALVAGFEALLRPYVEERVIDDVAARPPGSVPVDFTLFAVPTASAPPA